MDPEYNGLVALPQLDCFMIICSMESDHHGFFLAAKSRNTQTFMRIKFPKKGPLLHMFTKCLYVKLGPPTIFHTGGQRTAASKRNAAAGP